MENRKDRAIAILGLGYVGLPLLVAFSSVYKRVVGYDIDAQRISELSRGIDSSGYFSKSDLAAVRESVSSDDGILSGADVFIIALPTPVDSNNNPDLTTLLEGTSTVGRYLRKGSLVVYESTVFPGVTEEICIPVLEEHSNLKCGRDFKVGYSPERINPGDHKHTLANVIKIVSGCDKKALEEVCDLYSSIVSAGLYKVSCIKVAEAAKVIENTQRDINIALMNEFALIFDKAGISTNEVLKAAGTKWNFVPFTPGLVGGHCIGVDPYYLTTFAKKLGLHPEVILSGRRINDTMGVYVAQKVVKLLIKMGVVINKARVGVLGVAFKENVSDFRNSRVPDMIAELEEYGIEVLVHDPLVDPDRLRKEYNIILSDLKELKGLDGVVLAVPHDSYVKRGINMVSDALSSTGGVFVDVKAAFIDDAKGISGIKYWSLA